MKKLIFIVFFQVFPLGPIETSYTLSDIDLKYLYINVFIKPGFHYTPLQVKLYEK